MSENIFKKIVAENPEHDGIAVVYDGRKFSYGELFADVERISGELTALGIKAGDRCGFIAPDSYEYIVYSLALLNIDAALIPLSSRAVRSELDRMITEVPMEFLIAEKSFADAGAWQNIGDFRVKQLVCNAGKITLPGSRKAAFIRFSSGTTGKNKGVILSHEAVLERTAACTALTIGKGEFVLWVLDMAYHFVVTIILFLRRGASIVICPDPKEVNMAKLLAEYPATLLYATPYHYQVMVNYDEYTGKMLEKTKLCISTAMRLSGSVARAFYDKFGIPLNQAYGIIEVGLPCINDMSNIDKQASVGVVQQAYEVRIDNPDADGTGEILLKGPGMFDAYLAPFKLRDEVCRNGYFVTGDLGRLDADGALFIVGRSKNVIIFAGMKIFPYEVEEVLAAHKEVKEVRVSGMAHPLLGELPVAEIVPARCLDAAESDALVRELRRYCYEKLAEYKVPKDFRFVDELSKTASGKLLRK